MRPRLLFPLVVVTLLLGYGYYGYTTPLPRPMEKRSIQQVVELYGAASQSRLQPFFAAAKATYPPSAIHLLAIKDEKKLELWTEEPTGRFFIRAYPIKAASGVTGPKLREGDKQVPEGVYRLEYLNPNSAYHLSMKLDYPNAFDRQHARAEGRTQPGGDIFIHGNAVSIGCLAVGDPAIEELFTLVAAVGIEKVKVVIAPSDPRKQDILPLAEGQPAWVTGLYEGVTAEFADHRIFDQTASTDPSQTFMGKCH